MSSTPSVSQHPKMLSPLSSQGTSPSPATESNTADSESIDSSSQPSLSKSSRGICTPSRTPSFNLSNLATNGSYSNQASTTMDPVSESSTAAASSGIPDTLQSTVTRNDERNKLKENMDLDEPHQVGASHSAKNAISNTKSNKRESDNDESHQAGTSHSAKKLKKNAGQFNDGLDGNKISPDADDLSGMRMTRARKRSAEKKIETTNNTVNESLTAQPSNAEVNDAAASQNNTGITSGVQRGAANMGHLTEAQGRDYSVEFKPEPYRSRKVYTLVRPENKNTLSFRGTKPRVPVDDAQYIWLQSQPKDVRDKAENVDREGTSDLIGTFLEKTRKTLPNGDRVEDSLPVHYTSQFIKDHHAPISEDRRKQKGKSQTFKFKTYFPASALIETCPHLNVEFIETELETKSEESFALKAKIQEAIKIQKTKNVEAAKAARAAKAAEAVARGRPVASAASSSASSADYIRVGLECEMILDD
ncbi:hypothetical protein BTUL_0004g00370 [Botrytis tulipae]|uniref:Uncharacterized protein n=1 Tax=Botrytis tulipae TaxID=87230 RepID=A0A4Z1FDA7_9HELO|nr:hypothetical protein BTUL_0004g00370 [Botrytis tulipae]